jgi:hypothetical protein
MVTVNLLHGEAQFGDNLLEGSPLAAVPKVIISGAQGAAILFGQLHIKRSSIRATSR